MRSRRGVTSWSEACRIDRLKPSLTSKLATLIRIPTNMSQWRHSWLGEKQPRRISMVSTSTINRDIFSVCCFCWRNDMEGSPGSTCATNSNHVSENVQTNFECAGMDKQSNCNLGCKIILTYGKGSRTRNWNWASVWCIKFLASINLRSNPIMSPRHQYNPTPTHPRNTTQRS